MPAGGSRIATHALERAAKGPPRINFPFWWE
jgi:hypothetical protein